MLVLGSSHLTATDYGHDFLCVLCVFAVKYFCRTGVIASLTVNQSVLSVLSDLFDLSVLPLPPLPPKLPN